MTNQSNKHSSYLFWGDVLCFVVALIASLAIRTLGLPDWHLLQLHIIPFGIIFCIWLIVYYIGELYDFRTGVFASQLGARLINAQLVNSGIAILVFYFIPYFGITPKTVLFIDLLITLIFVFLWRFIYFRRSSRRERERTYIMGAGPVVTEVKSVLRANPYLGLEVVEQLDSSITVVVLDLSDPQIAARGRELFPLIFTRVRFLDLQSVYEQAFGRIALSLLSDMWFVGNISLRPKPFYTLLKRAMDIALALPLFVLSLVIYPFVALVQKLESPGPLFYVANRVGENNKLVPIYKFRTMTGVDFDKPADLKTTHKVTKVGRFLRRSRIDELPQLFSVLRGDMSLVGPRPELPTLVAHYTEQVPFYTMRHVVKPGLSGWAQVNDYNVPREAADVELTRNKLSYDLFYIKNRSLWLDLKIALKTIKTLLSRVGA